MKRVIVLFLVVLLIGLSLSSCNTTKTSPNYPKYTSLVADVANDYYGASIELHSWQGSYFTKEKMKDKTCTIGGVSYTSSYSKSIISLGDSYTTDIYKNENYFEFDFRSDTGELVGYQLTNQAFYDTEPYLPDVSNPQETAIAMATNIASEYINIEEYTRIDKEPSLRYYEKDGTTYEMAYYKVLFVKEIHGFVSTDFIQVNVTSKGHLVSVSMGDLHAFDDIVLDFDVNKLNQSISEKIQAINTEKNYTLKEMHIEEQKIMLTPDQDVGVYSVVTFDFTYPSGDEGDSVLHIFTFLEGDK